MPYEKSEFGEELLIIPAKDGGIDPSKACYLNKTAADIWRCLENISEESTLDSIAEMMVKKYNIDYDVAAADCATTIENLVSNGFVVKTWRTYLVVQNNIYWT